MSNLVHRNCYLLLRALTIRLGSPKHQHHPRKQYRLHQDIPRRLRLRDKRDVLKLPLSFQSLRPQYQSVLAEYLSTGYWRCILEQSCIPQLLGYVLLLHDTLGMDNSLTQEAGSVVDGTKRPPLYLIGNDLTFVLNVTIEDFTVWTETGNVIVNKINNIFGAGDGSYGANDGIQTLQGTESPYTYTSTYTVTASPITWSAPSTPTWAAPSTGYGSKIKLYHSTKPQSNSLQLRLRSLSINLLHFGARVLLTMIFITGEHSSMEDRLITVVDDLFFSVVANMVEFHLVLCESQMENLRVA